ncbi:MAG: gliding motility lipoprotein GldH [Adhaeribacter sp.]
MSKQFFACMLFLALWVCSACDPNRIYEENIDIKDYNWKIADVKEFNFAITDTTKTYQIFFNVRNALGYEYYNLYLSQTLIGPDREKLYSRLHEMYLMDPKTGEPLGSGAGDIFDHTFLAVKAQRFTKVGTYKIRLRQYMRKNPLAGIMAVGVKIAVKEE